MNWDYSVRTHYFEMTDSISVEDLYQAFKKRMQHEARMAQMERDEAEVEADREALNEVLGWGAPG